MESSPQIMPRATPQMALRRASEAATLRERLAAPITASGRGSEPAPELHGRSPRLIDRLRSAPTMTLQLADKRQLCWAEFGAAAGIPVLYFHSRGSSRLEAAFFAAEAESRGFRLIAVDRPGIGGSDFRYARTPEAFCEDLAELMGHLEIKTLSTLSLGAGAAYSLALARRLGDRIKAQMCLGSIPVGPLWGTEERGRLTRRRALLARAMRHAFRLRVEWESRLSSSRGVLDDLCSSDRRALADSEVIDLLAADAEEARRQGLVGIAQDDSIAIMPFDCDLDSIRCAVTFWQGASDPTCLGRTPALLAQRLRYGRERASPRLGQFFFLSVMAEIFQQVSGLPTSFAPCHGQVRSTRE